MGGDRCEPQDSRFAVTYTLYRWGLNAVGINIEFLRSVFHTSLLSFVVPLECLQNFHANAMCVTWNLSDNVKPKLFIQTKVQREVPHISTDNNLLPGVTKHLKRSQIRASRLSLMKIVKCCIILSCFCYYVHSRLATCQIFIR